MRLRGMKTTWLVPILALLWMLAPFAYADASAHDDETAIRAALGEQVKAWNRGDIPAFMATYEDSPDTAFIGTTINHGHKTILDRYKKAYSTPDQMGTLTFNGLEVRLLPSSTGATEYAIVTGHFHLDRKTKGEAKKDDGIFSLVWRKSAGGWKIVLDHTS